MDFSNHKLFFAKLLLVRSIVFIVSITLYILSVLWIATHGPTGASGFTFVSSYMCAFLGMAGLWWSWPKKFAVPLLITTAIIVRIIMTGYPPNDDIYRYMWEGRIQLKGENPYSKAPDDPSLVPYHDKYWSSINHKSWSAIYQPAAELLFRCTSAVSHTPMAFKIVSGLFDLAVLLILILFLRLWSMPIRHVILYAFHPLVLISCIGEGHLEIIAVFWVLLSLYLYKRQRWGWMYLFFGLAIMTKITMILALPFIIKRENIKYMVTALFPCLLIFFFTYSNNVILGVPIRFASELHYNSLGYNLLNHIFSSVWIQRFSILLFCSAFLSIFFIVPDKLRAVLYCYCAFMLFTPTLHPWYLLLPLALLPLYRSVTLLVFTATISFSFLIQGTYLSTGIWKESTIVLWLEYLPPAIVWLFVLLKGYRHGPGKYAPPRDISVIIPVLNEENSILECLGSIPVSKYLREIIIADGGSTDNTLAKALSIGNRPIILVPSEKGRGIQIATGIKKAQADLILILHSDSHFANGAFECLISTLTKHPHIVGGAFNAKYNDMPGGKFFVSSLNYLRALFTGISFGDQTQFFRREFLKDLPDLYLMEDIEMSLQCKEFGAVVLLPVVLHCSGRRWKKKKYRSNVVLVLWLTSLYLVRRRFGLIRDRAFSFYQAYYG